MGYEIRPMQRSDLDLAIDWAAREGWNPGLADGDSFYATDPGGFLMGFLDGEPIASISVVAYGEDYGFLGFYIVKEGYRGQGYGLKIWQAGMARLAGRTIGLDGVVDQQPNYRKSGFVLAHQNLRYAGKIETEGTTADQSIVELSDVDPEVLAAYDRAHVPAARAAFLKGWLDSENRSIRVVLRNGEIAGYGVIRQCREGYKIGPLFAEDAATAERLFHSLAAEAKGETVFIDPPGPNKAAIGLAERHGMTPMFETARMYAGSAPDLPLDQIFSITTFELAEIRQSVR